MNDKNNYNIYYDYIFLPYISNIEAQVYIFVYIPVTRLIFLHIVIMWTIKNRTIFMNKTGHYIPLG